MGRIQHRMKCYNNNEFLQKLEFVLGQDDQVEQLLGTEETIYGKQTKKSFFERSQNPHPPQRG